MLDLSGGSDVDSVAMVYPVSRDKLISTVSNAPYIHVWLYDLMSLLMTVCNPTGTSNNVMMQFIYFWG